MLQILILLMTFGTFTGASDIDYDIQGNIYVVDRSGNMLVKLSPLGDSLRAVSGFGRGTLQFDGPVAVCARRGNDIYVADYNNHRIQRFNRTLDLVATIYTRDDADEWSRFGYPLDMAVTRQGNLLIVDGENRRIVKINTAGQGVESFGDINAGEGRLYDPSKIEVDESDNAYVLDGRRIIQFDPFGSYVRTIPSPTDSIVSISIDRDTLLIAGKSAVALYDLATLSHAGTYELGTPAMAIRYSNGRFIGVEQKRGVVYGAGEDIIRNYRKGDGAQPQEP
jgi:hypothetical protein